MLIRAVTPEDAAPLGRLHADAWQAAYAGQMPARVLERATPENRIAMWERLTAAGTGPGEHILVAELDGEVAGFVHTGPCREQDVPGGLGELFAINVAPARWGLGVGRLLLAAAEDALRAEGFDESVLWVLPGNARARRFYEANGWVADGGAREVSMAGAAIAEVRYRITARLP
jgi:GNAT superfamily N-acetyltransferase